MPMQSDLYSFLSSNNNVYVAAPIIPVVGSLILQATSAECRTARWIKGSRVVGRAGLMDALR